MAIVQSRKSGEKSIRIPNKQKWTSVRVLDIILNLNHPKFEELGGYDSIGTIFYTKLDDNTPYENPSIANIAKPLFTHLKYYPLINEIVLILSTDDKNIYNGDGSDNKSSYYLPQINIWNHPHHNALPSISGLDAEANSNDYQQTENGIIRKVEDGSTNIKLGDYFEEQTNIKPLLPYEGDMIIEGRFGNSIRFGSTNIGDTIPDENKNQWSQIGTTGDPITIIRNGQPEETDEKGWVPLIEDSNNNSSIIYMTSNQQITNFLPASINQQSFGANIEEVKTLEQELTDFTPETVVEPEVVEVVEEVVEEEIPKDEPPPISTPTPITTSPTGSQDDEFTPFDLFAGDEELDWYEVAILDQYEPSPDDDTGSTDTGETETPNNGDLPNPDNASQSNLPTTYPCVVKNSKYGSEYDVHLHAPINAFVLGKLIEEQPKSDRVKFLCIHTSAGHQTASHIDMAWIFMKKWRRHGYNITIEPNGGCVQIYKDDGRYSAGVGKPGFIPKNATSPPNKAPTSGPYSIENKNSVNINWIGGHETAGLNMTRQQSHAINVFVLAYIKKYPDIKVVGHNQFRGKQCPWFYVPEYLKELQKTEPSIKAKNIYDKNYNTAMPAIAQADYLTGARDVANIIQQPEGRNV